MSETWLTDELIFPAFAVVQSLDHVWLFMTPGTAACQASLSITNFWSLLKLMSIESVMPSSHLILCHLLLLPSIFPMISVFSSESVLHNQVAKELELQFQYSSRFYSTGGNCIRIPDSRLLLSLLYGPTLTSIHDYWVNHSSDYRDLCRQSNVSAFQHTV